MKMLNPTRLQLCSISYLSGYFNLLFMWFALASFSFEGSLLWQSPDFTSVCSLGKATKLFPGLGSSLQRTILFFGILLMSRKCPFLLFIAFFVTFIPQHISGSTYWGYLPLTLRSFQNCLMSTVSKSELALPNFSVWNLSKSMMPSK